MKKTLALFSILVLLMGAFPLTAAAETVLTTDAFSDDVMYSTTDSNLSGWGLAFAFTLKANGVNKSYNGNTDLTNATLTYENESCKITRIGAVVTHLGGVGTDDSRMVRETASGSRNTKDVKISRMYRVNDKKTSATFAVRIVNIPYQLEEQVLYARPYVEIEYQGERLTLYGKTASASYAEKMAETYISLPFYGADVDGKERIFIGDTAVLGDTLYLEIQDELDEWMTMFDPKNPDVIYYACYDKEGKELTLDEEDYGCIYIRDISSTNATEVFEITLPAGTAEVKITGADIIYWVEWE